MTTLQELTAQVAAAYFTNVSVSPSDIPMVMGSISQALREAVQTPAPDAPEEAAAPALSAASESTTRQSPDRIAASIRPDALISFEDGRPYKVLTRHLAKLGLTPAEYRAKHELPDDYPMTAPQLSARRADLAKKNQLGRKRT